MLAGPSLQPSFFDPIARFGPLDEDERISGPRPLLLVLPGLDGSGITAWAQFPELAREYEVLAMEIPPDDRSSYTQLVDVVADMVASGLDKGRQVFVVGESMGAGIALDVHLCESNPQLGARCRIAADAAVSIRKRERLHGESLSPQALCSFRRRRRGTRRGSAGFGTVWSSCRMLALPPSSR